MPTISPTFMFVVVCSKLKSICFDSIRNHCKYRPDFYMDVVSFLMPTIKNSCVLVQFQ